MCILPIIYLIGFSEILTTRTNILAMDLFGAEEKDE